MKKLIFILSFSLSAKEITLNDVYTQAVLIQDHIHFLLKHYGIKHHYNVIMREDLVRTKLQPRDSWQKAYEILVKINMLRKSNNLPRIEPVGMEPVEKLNPDMVYGMTQRVLTEIRIFEVRKGIKIPNFKLKSFTNKTPLDVYNTLGHISMAFDELNRSSLSPSYVYAETIRIYGDLTMILNKLNIKDNTRMIEGYSVF